MYHRRRGDLALCRAGARLPACLGRRRAPDRRIAGRARQRGAGSRAPGLPPASVSASPPTAVFASVDLLAIGALQEARSRGLAVPDDLSIIGFDDIALASMVFPPLTTIAQPTQELGRLATEMLLERIRKPEMPAQRRVLDTRLVIRGTTAPPPGLAENGRTG